MWFNYLLLVIYKNMTTALRSFSNTVVGLLGYGIPLLLGTHAEWLNITIGGLILWAYNHFIAPKINNNGIVGVVRWEK